MGRYVIYQPQTHRRPPMAVDYSDRAVMLREEIEAYEQRVEIAEREIGELRQRLADKRAELAEVRRVV